MKICSEPSILYRVRENAGAYVQEGDFADDPVTEGLIELLNSEKNKVRLNGALEPLRHNAISALGGSHLKVISEKRTRGALCKRTVLCISSMTLSLSQYSGLLHSCSQGLMWAACAGGVAGCAECSHQRSAHQQARTASDHRAHA